MQTWARIAVSAALGSMLLIIPQASIAQGSFPLGALVPPPGTHQQALNADDINRMNAAAEQLYRNRSIGTVERWRNPDSKNAGAVKLLSRFEAQGMPCWRMRYTIRFERTRNEAHPYVINWCNTADGEWKILEGGPPS